MATTSNEFQGFFFELVSGGSSELLAMSMV